LASLQAIAAIAPESGSDREFLAGARMSGAFFALNLEAPERFVIGEGLATAASAAEGGGRRGVVAFSASNLDKVA
jgi:phage/plasmid primase-like uncharacterized protein